MTTDGDDVFMIIYLGKPIAQATNKGIDSLFRDANALGVGPNDVDYLISAADCPGCLVQHVQEAELRQREWWRKLLA